MTEADGGQEGNSDDGSEHSFAGGDVPLGELIRRATPGRGKGPTPVSVKPTPPPAKRAAGLPSAKILHNNWTI